MRNHPVAAALAVAGVLAGAHAGIAAISESKESNPPTVALQPEPLPAPDTQAATTPEAQPDAAASAPVAQAPVDTLPKSVPMPGASSATLQNIAVRDKDDEYLMRIPFTNRTIKVTVATFPSSPSEVGETAPSVVAYFERKNGNTQLAGGPQPVFPSAGNDDMVTAPHVVAYFERQDAARLAALKAQQDARQTAAAALASAASVADTPSTAAAGNTPAAQTPGG